jgi:Bacterial protein of unknown function (DUF899)
LGWISFRRPDCPGYQQAQTSQPLAICLQSHHRLPRAGYSILPDSLFDACGEIFHTYSTYGRGNEYTPSLYSLLDLTVLGRQEAWEEPKDRTPVVHAT